MLFNKKRNFKIIISALVICILAAMQYTSLVFAETNTMEEYSNITGISTEDLNKISDIYGQDFLEETVSTSYQNDVSPASLEDPNLPVEQISIGEYWAAIAHGEKGQIWITKDGNFSSVNHGHAGILYAYSVYYISFVEHGGADYRGLGPYGDLLPAGYSGINEWDNYDGINTDDEPWRKCHTLRTYNVITPTSIAEGTSCDLGTMISAADYAATYLLGKPYNALANKEYYEAVNCATLVYRAYKNANVFGGTSTILGNPDSPTVIPKDLVEDTQLTLAFSAQWEGNQHVWNE